MLCVCHVSVNTQKCMLHVSLCKLDLNGCMTHIMQQMTPLNLPLAVKKLSYIVAPALEGCNKDLSMHNLGQP